MLAILQRKLNVYNGLSGWSSRYIPESLLREAAGRLNHEFLFGSDYPFITSDRWMADFLRLDGWNDEARQRALWGNGARLLGRTAIGQMTFG